VVVVMAALPDTWWSNHIDAKDGENGIGYTRFSQYGMMLKVVKNDEKS